MARFVTDHCLLYCSGRYIVTVHVCRAQCRNAQLVTAFLAVSTSLCIYIFVSSQRNHNDSNP